MDQTSPDSGAQLGAQAAEYGQPAMAQISADLDILQRVLGRHSVSQDGLARRCNIAPGYLSRVLSGQHPVTFMIYRAVWEMTRDPELIGLLDVPGHRVVIVDDQLSHSLHSLRHFAARACERVCGPSSEPLVQAVGRVVDEPRAQARGHCCPPNRLDVMG